MLLYWIYQMCILNSTVSCAIVYKIPLSASPPIEIRSFLPFRYDPWYYDMTNSSGVLVAM